MILNKTERENYQLLDSAYSKDINKVKINAETEFHFLAKCKIAYYLKKNNRKFVCEGRFKDGSGRADIIDLTNSICYEVVHSEKQKSILIKKDKYPIGLIELDANLILQQEYDDLWEYLD